MILDGRPLRMITAQSARLVSARRQIATLPFAMGIAHASWALRFSSTGSTPFTIADRSFWRSLIPKPLRRAESRHQLGKGKTKEKGEWNPATFFIVMFLFIGSMSIQMLALRHQAERYMRQSSLRIAQLREIVEKIQAGEDVDVEKMLGTGDPQKEAEWEQVLQAIEREEAMRKPRQSEQPTKSDTKGRTAVHMESQESTATAEAAPAKTKPANFGSFF